MKILFLSLITLSLFANEIHLPSSRRISAAYSTLDPTSISQNFAFYELYPETKEGHLALRRAWDLLKVSDDTAPIYLPEIQISSLINVINRKDEEINLSENELIFIESLGKHLHNRKLSGHKVWTRDEVLALAPEEIDLCRGLFIEQYGESKEAAKKTRMYEAMIDLMTLQILGRLNEDATPLEKIYAINNYIFHEMGFRFPPHSLHAKDIDEYTFLPSVIDSRKGVCLGVSILYLCIAQRLDLELEAVTPPGHIYVRYVKENGDHYNIETTARGINVPTERYLGVETRDLQLRTMKEVIGLAFINQASVNWMKKKHETAVTLYEKALAYMPNDYLLKQLLGYNYLLSGRKEEGRKMLESTQDETPEFSVSKDTMKTDFLSGKTDVEGIDAVFMHVDETRKSILEKQKRLQEVVKKYPLFRAGLLQLAGTYLQLGREKEAYPILEVYHAVDDTDPVVNYYLAVISFDRYDYTAAWKYLKRAEELVHSRDHNPRALKEFRKVLARKCPTT